MAELERGLSTALGYAMGLGITLLLVTGLLLGAGGFADDERRQAIHAQSDVIGKHVASDVMAASRLATTAGGEVRIQTELPSTIGGRSYTIRIDASDSAVIVSVSDPDVTVVTSYEIPGTVSVRSTTVEGGPVVVHYTGSTLEVVADE